MFLVPTAIEVIPSAVKAIKTLINGDGNKIEKQKQDTVLFDQEAKNNQRSMTALSDNELDLIAINRLI